jgi:hypothetical protein
MNKLIISAVDPDSDRIRNFFAWSGPESGKIFKDQDPGFGSGYQTKTDHLEKMCTM